MPSHQFLCSVLVLELHHLTASRILCIPDSFSVSSSLPILVSTVFILGIYRYAGVISGVDLGVGGAECRGASIYSGTC
jgi:hypothetical protein